jgi:hypothetical protein
VWRQKAMTSNFCNQLQENQRTGKLGTAGIATADQQLKAIAAAKTSQLAAPESKSKRSQANPRKNGKPGEAL